MKSKKEQNGHHWPPNSADQFGPPRIFRRACFVTPWLFVEHLEPGGVIWAVRRPAGRAGWAFVGPFRLRKMSKRSRLLGMIINMTVVYVQVSTQS